MLNFAFGAPYVPPAPPVSPWQGFALSWTGWDGSVWALSNPRAGRFLRKGVVGLGMPEYERHKSESPAIPGSRHLGTSTKERAVFWPLYEYSDTSSAEFLKYNRAFWRTMDPDRPGVWSIVLPGGEVRTLGCRYINSPDVLRHDPIKSGWLGSGIDLVAENPYWRGETARRAWGQSVPKNYYVTLQDRINNGWSDDVIHYLSNGMELGSATFTNEGDVDAFPVWSAVGPTTAVSFGVGDSVVNVPFTIPAGYAVQIDTDPVDGQVLWYGEWDEDSFTVKDPVDRTEDLDPLSMFVAVPAGEDRKLAITMTGTGAVLAALTPQYRRAYS